MPKRSNRKREKWMDAGLGTCAACGKMRYPSRSAAKKGARGKHRPGTPQPNRFRFYECGGYWHAASWTDAAEVAFLRRIDASGAGDSR